MYDMLIPLPRAEEGASSEGVTRILVNDDFAREFHRWLEHRESMFVSRWICQKQNLKIHFYITSYFSF